MRNLKCTITENNILKNVKYKNDKQAGVHTKAQLLSILINL